MKRCFFGYFLSSAFKSRWLSHSFHVHFLQTIFHISLFCVWSECEYCSCENIFPQDKETVYSLLILMGTAKAAPIKFFLRKLRRFILLFFFQDKSYPFLPKFFEILCEKVLIHSFRFPHINYHKQSAIWVQRVFDLRN